MNKMMIGILLTFIFAWTPAWAVKVKTLYEVEVSVPSQSADARSEAIREGFQEVLVKLTGNQNIDKNKIIRSSLNKADYFVQEYSYSSPTVTSATYNLRIKYNEQDVRRLLRKAGAASWGETRPLILVWLATVNDRHEVDILGVETEHAMLERFKREGQRFGLPLIFPVMDVADMEKITSDNITAVALPELKEASKRYEPDALLIGTIEYDGEIYTGRWNLVWGEKAWDWSLEGDTREKLFTSILDNVSQVLSQRKDAKPAPELSQN